MPPPRACCVINYVIGQSGQTLALTEAAISHFELNRQLTVKCREAGGQLFARVEGKLIRIERATGPRPSDRRWRMSFLPNRLAERREIKRLFKEGLLYVGDWHTHPELIPRPSHTDINSVQDMYIKSRHGLASFVMVIVGSAPPPQGLFVSLCDGKKLHKLTQSSVTPD